MLGFLVACPVRSILERPIAVGPSAEDRSSFRLFLRLRCIDIDGFYLHGVGCFERFTILRSVTINRRSYPAFTPTPCSPMINRFETSIAPYAANRRH
jgi:hypothetical protein